jgi:nucleoid DNA-binding protein
VQETWAKGVDKLSTGRRKAVFFRDFVLISCGNLNAEKEIVMATDKKAKPLNKSQLATTLSEKTGLTKTQVNAVMTSLDEVIKHQLGKTGPGVVQLPGLLKLQIKARPAQPAKKGRNPATGEEITIAAKKASKRIAARPLKALKDAVL